MALDLLTWPEVTDAKAAVASAYAEKAEAQRRYLFAPHGQKIERLKALQAAVQQALNAELALAAVLAGEG